jgi:hypothetical protein
MVDSVSTVKVQASFGSVGNQWLQESFIDIGAVAFAGIGPVLIGEYSNCPTAVTCVSKDACMRVLGPKHSEVPDLAGRTLKRSPGRGRLLGFFL